MQGRTHRILAIALALPLAASCGKQPGYQEITVHRVKASPTAKPTARPATGTPAPHPSGSPPTPVPSNQALPGTTLRVDGLVFDEAGALVEGVLVGARSLDPRRPYERAVITQGGSYHLDDVPEGVNVALTAYAPGWTERRQVRAFAAAVPAWNRCDFGALDGDDGAPGAAYFLAERPEIVRTEPADGAAGVGADAASVRVVLNAPLEGVYRARLVRALRLLPANDAANAGLAGSTTDVQGLADQPYPRVLAVDGNPLVAPYDIRQGSVFRADTSHQATCSWDADGLGLVLTLPGPLQAPRGSTAAYQLVLVSAGPDEAIRDARGHLLGGDAAGGTDQYPPAGQLVPGVFKREALAVRPLAGVMGGAWRWAATHGDAVRFALADPDAPPVLQGLQVATVGGDTRIDLTFSRPMAAYDGTTTGLVHASVAELDHYAFALAETAADLAGVALDRAAARQVDPRAVAGFGAGERAVAFAFAPGAYVASPAGAPVGSVAVEVNPTDARRVQLTIVGRPRFFDAHAMAIAARTSGLAGPGGHRIGDAEADQHVVKAAL